MKTLLVILSLAVLAHADGDHGHDHHGDHHAPPANHHGNHHDAPVSSYSDLPPADPPTYHQPAAPIYHTPAPPTYKQPAAPVDNSNYYYYPVEDNKKEKDFFGKIKDEYDSFKVKASNFDIKSLDTRRIVIVSLVIGIALLVFGPTIAAVLGIGGITQAIVDWITNLIAANGGGRDIEINTDDIMRYAATVYKAINKKYWVETHRLLIMCQI